MLSVFGSHWIAAFGVPSGPEACDAAKGHPGHARWMVVVVSSSIACMNSLKCPGGPPPNLASLKPSGISGGMRKADVAPAKPATSAGFRRIFGCHGCDRSASSRGKQC